MKSISRPKNVSCMSYVWKLNIIIIYLFKWQYVCLLLFIIMHLPIYTYIHITQSVCLKLKYIQSHLRQDSTHIHTSSYYLLWIFKSKVYFCVCYLFYSVSRLCVIWLYMYVYALVVSLLFFRISCFGWCRKRPG